MAVGAVHVTTALISPVAAVEDAPAGQLEITGETLSTIPAWETTTSNWQTATFPDGSLKVYVTVVVPTRNESPGLCEDVTTTTPPDESVADGTVHVAAALLDPTLACALACAGQLEITGGVLSVLVIVTVKEHVALLPDWSVKV